MMIFAYAIMAGIFFALLFFALELEATALYIFLALFAVYLACVIIFTFIGGMVRGKVEKEMIEAKLREFST
jgi:hypothetical protein